MALREEDEKSQKMTRETEGIKWRRKRKSSGVASAQMPKEVLRGHVGYGGECTSLHTKKQGRGRPPNSPHLENKLKREVNTVLGI